MTDDRWLEQVQETVRDLEDLEFTGTGNEAQALLRSEGRGRARATVLAAMRLRRGDDVARPVADVRRDVEHWQWRVNNLEDDLRAARGRLEIARRRADEAWG
jgi:hypothetical protein